MQYKVDTSLITPQDIYDLTGQSFGPITVLKLDHIHKGRRFWLVRCVCGAESIRNAYEFRNTPPPCAGCEIAELRKNGTITPDWAMALGFDETFWSRFWPHVDKNGPVPSHVPHLGPCHIWLAGVTSRGRGSIGQRRVNGKTQLISTHVASWIIHNRQQVPDGLCVLHHCDIPRCLRPEHLFAGTIKRNSDDMISRGRARHVRGEAVSTSKLTSEQVLKIRTMRSMGCTYKDLAASFNCSPSNIAWIIKGHYWKHLI